MSRVEMVWGLVGVAAIAMLVYVVIPAVGIIDDNSSRLDELENKQQIMEYRLLSVEYHSGYEVAGDTLELPPIDSNAVRRMRR